MNAIDRAIQEIASRQHWLVTRGQVIDAGGTPALVRSRLKSGRWQALQRGVYLVTPEGPTWWQRLRAATLFGGGTCVASHRAALYVHGCDGFDDAPLEVLVPMSERTAPTAVVPHRTRRLDPSDLRVVRDIPVTKLERSLVDGARFASATALEKAYESGLRRGIVTETSVASYARSALALPGARYLLRLLDSRLGGGPAGSGAEVELGEAMRHYGLHPLPVRQFEVLLPSGRRAYLDTAWPDLMAFVEVDGVDAHSGRVPLESDLSRQNELLDLGWRFRRWTGTQVRRDPEGVVSVIQRFLDDCARTPCVA